MSLNWTINLKDIDLSSPLSEDDVFTGLVDYGLFSEKIPPCFSSKGLVKLPKSTLFRLLDETDEITLKGAIDKRAHDFMRYESLRDINIPRHLGIPHPESHIVQALAIKKYWKEILEHCNKPSQKVSRIYVRHVGGGRIFEMNYKGPEQFELEEKEIGWMSGAKYLVTADISSCFPSIYTHCIPWAFHSLIKAKAKRKLTELPGNLLDKCTQITRDNQTNGLLIGPHSSNIISEIILTSIDFCLLSKGYKKLKRHIDDYDFYANSYNEAEHFIRDLGMALRDYELCLNEKKTKIQELPRPSTENWVRELNLFRFTKDETVSFTSIRAFLDLALELAQAAGSSAPLNYAIKMIPDGLNARAKRLFVQEAISLALFYPYLAPLLERYVFLRHHHEGMTNVIGGFCSDLSRIGIQKLYPDAIAHSLYYALRYKKLIKLSPDETEAILDLDDGITTVLFLEYATKWKLKKVLQQIKQKAAALKKEDKRGKDRQWLFLYQTWKENELRGNGQEFLADLKTQNFQFLNTP